MPDLEHTSTHVHNAPNPTSHTGHMCMCRCVLHIRHAVLYALRLYHRMLHAALFVFLWCMRLVHMPMGWVRGGSRLANLMAPTKVHPARHGSTAVMRVAHDLCVEPALHRRGTPLGGVRVWLTAERVPPWEAAPRHAVAPRLILESVVNAAAASAQAMPPVLPVTAELDPHLFLPQPWIRRQRLHVNPLVEYVACPTPRWPRAAHSEQILRDPGRDQRRRRTFEGIYRQRSKVGRAAEAPRAP